MVRSHNVRRARAEEARAPLVIARRAAAAVVAVGRTKPMDEVAPKDWVAIKSRVATLSGSFSWPGNARYGRS